MPTHSKNNPQSSRPRSSYHLGGLLLIPTSSPPLPVVLLVIAFPPQRSIYSQTSPIGDKERGEASLVFPCRQASGTAPDIASDMGSRGWPRQKVNNNASLREQRYATHPEAMVRMAPSETAGAKK